MYADIYLSLDLAISSWLKQKFTKSLSVSLWLFFTFSIYLNHHQYILLVPVCRKWLYSIENNAGEQTMLEQLVAEREKSYTDP